MNNLILTISASFIFQLGIIAQPQKGSAPPIHSRQAKLSIEQFSKNLRQTLADSSSGWAYQIWDRTKLICSEAGGFRIASVDNKDQGDIEFDVAHRMHIASISKPITTMAMIKILAEKGLHPGNEIKNFLPQSWKVHSTLEKTTFTHLLEMRSGLTAENDALSSSYHSLKNLVEKGINPDNIGRFNYQNVSYGLLRVLIAELNGYSRPMVNIDSVYLEMVSANAYIDYVNRSILQPAGIDYAFCHEASNNPTMMYPFPYNGEAGLISGFSSEKNQDGNLSSFAGGLGWYLSVEEVGKLFSAVFNSEKILTKEQFDTLISFRFPFNKAKKTWGEYRSGMGMWIWSKPEAEYNCGLNTLYMLLPDNLLVVAFVNSKGKGIRNLRARILSAYEKSLP